MSREFTKPDKSSLPATDATSKAHAETAAFDSSAFASRAERSGGGDSSAATPNSAETLPEIFGRYRIARLLGRGGMGSVYLAHDEQLDRPVALKIPRLASDSSGSLIARFLREARAVALLSHPNICPVYDVGQIDGVHFLAMAYIKGRPLSQYLESAKPQPERGVALTVYKIALALQEAHCKGILHRDLKPANIMVDSRGEPIVMDFGLSYRLQDAESRLTQDGTVLGTPAYMAPEQIDNRSPISAAADVYSLGVVLFELLTGRCPFQGSVVSVIGQVLHSQPPTVSALRSDVSPALAAICMRAMDKDPAQRFASMKDFAAALAAFLKGKLTTATAMASPSPLTDLSSLESLLTSTEATFGGPLATSSLAGRSRRTTTAVSIQWIAIPVVIGAVAVIGALVFALSPAANDHKPVAAAGVTANTPPASSISPESSPVDSSPPVVKQSRTVESTPNITTTPESSAFTVAPATNEPLEAPKSSPIQPTEEPLGENRAADTAAPSSTPNLKDDKPEVAPPAEPVATDPSRTAKPPKQRLTSQDTPLSEFGFPPGEEPPTTPEIGNGPETIENKFQHADRNHDGKLDPTEVPFHVILRADKNADRMLDLKEVERAFARLKEKLFAPPNANEMRRLPKRPRGGPR